MANPSLPIISVYENYPTAFVDHASRRPVPAVLVHIKEDGNEAFDRFSKAITAIAAENEAINTPRSYLETGNNSILILGVGTKEELLKVLPFPINPEWSQMRIGRENTFADMLDKRYGHIEEGKGRRTLAWLHDMTNDLLHPMETLVRKSSVTITEVPSAAKNLNNEPLGTVTVQFKDQSIYRNRLSALMEQEGERGFPKLMVFSNPKTLKRGQEPQLLIVGATTREQLTNAFSEVPEFATAPFQHRSWLANLLERCYGNEGKDYIPEGHGARVRAFANDVLDIALFR